jgi:hypothetical protein
MASKLSEEKRELNVHLHFYFCRITLSRAIQCLETFSDGKRLKQRSNLISFNAKEHCTEDLAKVYGSFLTC